MSKSHLSFVDLPTTKLHCLAVIINVIIIESNLIIHLGTFNYGPKALLVMGPSLGSARARPGPGLFWRARA